MIQFQVQPRLGAISEERISAFELFRPLVKPFLFGSALLGIAVFAYGKYQSRMNDRLPEDPFTSKEFLDKHCARYPQDCTRR